MSHVALEEPAKVPQTRRVAMNPSDNPLSHRQVLEVMTGLLAGLFTVMLSSTIVATALPRIVESLHGTQRSYTWVITAALLASTVSTPIWGKFADLFNKKVLVQLALVVFVAASVGAGFSHNMGWLIGMRVVQGLGMGGLTALTQAVMGSIIPPRERGKYSGLMGGVMAISTVGGPLLGGVIVDSPLGWRWCYFVCIPLAVLALILLQLTLHLHHEQRRPKIDYLGAVLITIGASLPLLWVTFAGKNFDWWSWETGAMLGGAVVALGLCVVVELHHPEPMVPLRKLKNRNTILILIASIAVGIGMFAATTFLAQYFQIGRNYTPTHAGLLTIPLVGSMLVFSTGTGFLVSRTGRWKVFLVVGSLLLTGGLFGLSTADHATSIWQIGIFMAVMGAGVGSMMQNLVLAVQNSVDVRDIGAVSAVVSFFRSLGGAIGVSVLGAILANRVSDLVMQGLIAQYGPQAATQAGGMSSGDSLDLSRLPGPVVAIIRSAYGDATGHIFWVAAFVSIATIVVLLFVKEVPLRTTVRKLDELEETADVTAVAEGAAVDEVPAEPALAEEVVTTDGTVPAVVAPVEPATPEPEPAQAVRTLDDPSERTALAALDVLQVAQEQAHLQRKATGDAAQAAQERLAVLGKDVDAVLGEFHRKIAAVSAELDRSGLVEPEPRHTTAESLRAYEFTLLRESQANAERVVAAAEEQATQIIASAQTRADQLDSRSRSEIEVLRQQINQLRQAERELREQIDANLSE